MLPRLFRIKNSQEFSRIYKIGRLVNTKNFRLFYLPQDQNITRFGFVVSRKQAARIADRNRLKRILREAVRGSLGKIARGHDIVIQGKRSLLEMDHGQIKQELESLMRKANLWKNLPSE